MKYLRLTFLPLSWVYGLVMRLRRSLYAHKIIPSFQAPVPVVSIGNLSTGGTGKTPFAEFLLDHFFKKGLKPAYLSRGYGRTTKGCLKLDPTNVHPTLHGDEATQVCLKFPHLPVWVSEDRREGIRQILASGDTDLVILDDAFQHLKVRRDLDLLAIDAQRLPTSDFVLPAGNLREFRATMHLADYLIVNKLDSASQIPGIKRKLAKLGKEMAFCRPVFQKAKSFSQKAELQFEFRELPVILFSGIGNNSFFLKMAKEKGLDVKAFFKFADHYSYKTQDLQAILNAQKQLEKELGEKVHVITTEKDRMRLWGKDVEELGKDFIYFPIKLEWLEGKEAFLTKINRTIAQKLS